MITQEEFESVALRYLTSGGDQEIPWDKIVQKIIWNVFLRGNVLSLETMEGLRQLHADIMQYGIPPREE